MFCFESHGNVSNLDFLCHAKGTHLIRSLFSERVKIHSKRYQLSMPSRFIGRDSIRASYLRKHAEPKQLSSEKKEDADFFVFLTLEYFFDLLYKTGGHC